LAASKAACCPCLAVREMCFKARVNSKYLILFCDGSIYFYFLIGVFKFDRSNYTILIARPSLIFGAKMIGPVKLYPSNYTRQITPINLYYSIYISQITRPSLIFGANLPYLAPKSN
jgi:hypothetical protein